MINENSVGVALVFFNRPDVLEVTFEAVRKAAPKILFLIQDGPRDAEDFVNVERCRKIVEKVDWDCVVHKEYSESNLGCGLRVFSGVSHAFRVVDKLIIIEDDCVPSTDFFRFSSEMLFRYEFDSRIDMVCGMNHLDVYEKCPNDYFFCEGGSIWGWATWRRVWEKIDFNMGYLEDPYALFLLKNKYGKSLINNGFLLKDKLVKFGKISSWSYQRGLNSYLNNGLSIVPKYNLIINVGITFDSANSVGSMSRVPLGLRRIYKLKHHVIPRKLMHPSYIIPDVFYDKKVKEIMGYGSYFQFFCRKVETAFYGLIFGDFNSVYQRAKKYLVGWVN